MPSFLKKILIYTAIVAVGLYALILGVIYKKQESLLFHPQAVSEVQKKAYADLEYETEVDGFKLKGWLVNPGKENLVIYYGGNAEELSHLVNDMQKYENVSTLLLNYRGYGDSDGEPSEDALFQDALTVFDRVKPNYQKIILIGRSLGSGVATYVAGHREVAGVVLVTPYDSIVNVAKDTLPWAPMGVLTKHKFESYLYARKATAPGLFIVAGKDKIISGERSQGLFDAWAGKKKQDIRENATHNSISISPSVDPTILNFVNRRIR